MLRHIKNEKGVVLITSLMLTMVSLAIVLALLYFLTQSIKVTSATKRYKNTLEATYGGAEMVAFDVVDKAFKNFSTFSKVGLYPNMNFTLQTPNCFKQKLEGVSSSWSACSNLEKDNSLASIKSSPDMTFYLRGTSTYQDYKVYAKIVDTAPGNTDTSGLVSSNAEDSGTLISGGGSSYSKTGAGGVNIQHIPYTYRLEVQGEKLQNTTEQANVSVFYAH